MIASTPLRRRFARLPHAGLAALLPAALATALVTLAGDQAVARSSREREARRDDSGLSRPAGRPLMAIVALGEQRVTIYDADGRILRAPVSTGQSGYETPAGIYSLIQKEAEHFSNLYDDASMPFMQRITWSGVALHAGALPGYPASHGCIRLSSNFATRLWHLTKVGTRVIITRKEVAPVDIAAPALLTSAPKPAAPIADDDPGRGLGASIAVKTATAADVASSTSDGASLEGQPDAGEQAGLVHPISIFVSRKTQNLSVRQGFAPLFDTPIRIDQPDTPIGTHVFTAMATEPSAMRWTLVSIPDDARGEPRKEERKASLQASPKASVADNAIEQVNALLGRVHIPSNVYDRIAALLTPGSSLIISDDAVSDETGSDTDFIVLTH